MTTRPRREPIEKVVFDALFRARAARGEPVGPTVLEPADLDVVLRLEPLAGRRVLDLGAGDGPLSVELARRGARVVALDLARSGLGLARRRAVRDGVSFAAVCGTGHRLPFRDATFDRIAGSRVLHHLEVPLAAAELRRVLVPGGRAAFRETLDANPILAFCRERLAGRFGIARLSTPTERPLDRTDFESLALAFSTVRLAHPEFLFARIFDRNVLRHRFRIPNRLAVELDALVHRHLPFLRRWSYQATLVLEP